jgi:hypothetical protein
MTHEDAGKYGAKHPAGTAADPAIADALAERVAGGRLSCTAAHEVAETLGVTPGQVGKTADLLEYRINECQMGLFGYAPEKKIVKPAQDVADDLRDRLLQSAARGEIDCASCWRVAQALGIGKMAVSAACEALDLKIVHCQLGAF